MRDLDDKRKIIETLRDIPFICGACAKTGIPRSTVYRWLNEDALFKKKVRKAINRGNEMVNDIAYGKLIQKIKEGNMTALTYHLTRRHPYYKDKKNNNVKIEIKQKEESMQLFSMTQSLKKLPISKLPQKLRKRVIKKGVDLLNTYKEIDEKIYKENGISLHNKDLDQLEWEGLLQEVLNCLSDKEIKKCFKEIQKKH